MSVFNVELVKKVDDSYDIARILKTKDFLFDLSGACLLYTSPSPRDS